PAMSVSPQANRSRVLLCWRSDWYCRKENWRASQGCYAFQCLEWNYFRVFCRKYSYNWFIHYSYDEAARIYKELCWCCGGCCIYRWTNNATDYGSSSIPDD